MSENQTDMGKKNDKTLRVWGETRMGFGSTR